MDKLPDEIVLAILSHLDLIDLAKAQQLSHRFLGLARDPTIWKHRCFVESRAETQRRRQRLFAAQDERLVVLRTALHGLPGTYLGNNIPPDRTPIAESESRARAIANWDPSYCNSRLDFHQEYIQRHAPIAPLGWLKVPSSAHTPSSITHEATGVGVLRQSDGDEPYGVVAALDDGSVCIWDVAAAQARHGGFTGRPSGRSAAGLLSDNVSGTDRSKALADSKTIMTETGAVECVSIDNSRQRGFFAVQNTLHEVDLNTLQVASSSAYPFSITALSEVSDHSPLTVGTMSTVHIHDLRASTLATDDSVRCELIGGSMASHAVLTQQGPLSILHQVDSSEHSIWVAGRFTHLLNYDRRFFPRLRGTVHSGARISSLFALPHAHVPRSLNLMQNPDVSISDLLALKSSPGTTLLAGGVYKGKGSLEMYGLDSSTSITTSPDQQPCRLVSSQYQNRQTASSSKILSAVPHGGTIVCSDGDGNLKWLERDASTHVRTYNINDTDASGPSFNQLQSMAQAQSSSQEWDGTTSVDVWDPSNSNITTGEQGDIVQKIIPLAPRPSATAASRHVSDSTLAGGRGNELLLWTGDGRIGVLGFGYSSAVQAEQLHEEARSAEEKAREDAERQYSGRLRRALEGQASEARFMRGLGLGFDRYS